MSTLALVLALAAGPKVELKASPRATMLAVGQCSVEVRFVLSVDPRGDEDYYCPRVEWEWEDETRSTEESDCPPYDAAKPAGLRRAWTRVRHFKYADEYRIKVHLYRADRRIKTVEALATVTGWAGMSEERRREMGCAVEQ